MTNQLKTIKVQGGKEYAEVHTRVNYFRSAEQYKNWSEDCVIVAHAEDMSWILMKAIISYPDGRIASVGHAYEEKDGSRINQRNHVENCETSAVGRALGLLGIGSDGSIASYEEVANAIENDKKDNAPTKAERKEYILETDNWAKALKYIASKKDTMSLNDIIKTFEDQKYGKLTAKDKAEVKKAYEGK
jgi:hypothetical protein